jgi:hypothetical protein
MNITGIPMEMALQLISRYIYDHKGVIVRVKPPTTPREIELFEQMIAYPLTHYNIHI